MLAELIALVLWIVAIYLLIVRWALLPTWAKVLGIIFVPFAPFLTILIVLLA